MYTIVCTLKCTETCMCTLPYPQQTSLSNKQTNKQQTCSIIPGNFIVLVKKPWGVEKGEGSTNKLKVRDGCWHSPW